MPQKAFFIGPYDKGLQRDVKPWMISDNAFEELRNAYVWRGRVKKRIGSKFLESTVFTQATLQFGSRLRIAITGGAGFGITDGFGDAASAVPGAVGAVGQMFSIGTTFYTVTTAGPGAQPMLRTDGTTTATFDTTNGNFVFVGAPATTQIYWYPANPVMGFINHERSQISNEPVYAFDTRFAYYRTGGAWERLGAATWSGSDSQFFWGTNYRGPLNDDYYLFVVNNNQADQIKYYTGAAWATMAPATRDPVASPNYTLHSARLIVSFKNRLIVLNTIEEVGALGVYHNFSNRARWCQNGTPIPTVPKPEPWYDNVPGKGGWIEAPTREAIITAKILKDRLLVYFERSTWELVYTGNQVLPFVWQVIDDSLGAESTFSSVLLDKVVFGVGESGIHACDGLHVQRIDNQIPELVSQIHNENSGVDRVAGIRDYSTEMAYWSFPDASNNGVYPNRLLAYNYKNETWALFDDSVTAFGYYQNTSDITWGACHSTWQAMTRRWVSGASQSQFKNVIAGNQEGFTFIFDRDLGRNAPSLQITDIDITGYPLIDLNVINHNLIPGFGTSTLGADYILLENINGITNMNGIIFKVLYAPDANTLRIAPENTISPPVGTYTGGGIITRVSKIEFKTKEFNFYGEDKLVAINKVNFDVDRTKHGAIKVGFYSSTSTDEMSIASGTSNAILGNYTLDTYPYIAFIPMEAHQSRLTHPVYIQAEGDCVQLLFWMDDELMFDTDVQISPFELNSMTIYVTPTGQRL